MIMSALKVGDSMTRLNYAIPLVILFLTGCFNSPTPSGFKPRDQVIIEVNTKQGFQSKLGTKLKLNSADHLFIADTHLPSTADIERPEFTDPVEQTVFGAGFRIKKYKFGLDVRPDKKSFDGLAEIQVKRLVPTLKSIILDMHKDLELLGAAIDDAVVNEVSRVDDQVEITLPATVGNTFKLVIQYKGVGTSVPRGMVFAENNGVVAQVWTVGEPQDARRWIPSVDTPDSKAPVEQIISVPDTWKVLANGTLLKKQSLAGNRVSYTWNADYPLPPYLISFVAGELEQVKPSNVGNVPVEFWVPHEGVAQAEMGFKLVPDMIRFFSTQLMDYPFDKFFIGVAYQFRGAMEHTSAVTFSHDLQSSDGYDSSTAAHELAHHWFGDAVTCQNWDDLWLNEGFATYFDMVFWEHQLGYDKKLERIEKSRRRYFQEEAASGNGSLGPIVNPELHPVAKFNTVTYEKGAQVLNVLRQELGESGFWGGLGLYLKKFKHSTATTQDLRLTLEEFTGRNLRAFFDQWIYQPGVPEISYRWRYAQGIGVEIEIKQLQKAPVPRFVMSPEVLVGTVDQASGSVSTERKRFSVGPQDGLISFAVSKEPDFVILDPDHWIPAIIKAEKSVLEWQTILNSSKAFLSQIDALEGLGKNATLLMVKNVLAQTGLHPMVKAQAYATLKYFNTEPDRVEALHIIKAGLNDSDVSIRTEAVRVLGVLKAIELVPELIEIFLNDPVWRVSMQAAMSLGDIKDPRAVDPLISELYRKPARGYIVSAVVRSLGRIGDKKATIHLIKRFEASSDMRTREGVIAALGDLKDELAVPALGKALVTEQMDSTSLVIIEALDKINSKEAISYLEKVADNPSRSDDIRAKCRSLLLRLKST